MRSSGGVLGLEQSHPLQGPDNSLNPMWACGDITNSALAQKHVSLAVKNPHSDMAVHRGASAS